MFNYGRVHWIITVFYIINTGLSMICQTIVVRWLTQQSECYKRLRVPYNIKLMLVIPGIAIGLTMVSAILPQLTSSVFCMRKVWNLRLPLANGSLRYATQDGTPV